MLAAGTREDGLHHAGIARALPDLLAVVVETVVGEVEADVDELHAPIVGGRPGAPGRRPGPGPILCRWTRPGFPSTRCCRRSANRWRRTRAWCWRRRPAPARPRACRLRCSTRPGSVAGAS